MLLDRIFTLLTRLCAISMLSNTNIPIILNSKNHSNTFKFQRKSSHPRRCKITNKNHHNISYYCNQYQLTKSISTTKPIYSSLDRYFVLSTYASALMDTSWLSGPRSTFSSPACQRRHRHLVIPFSAVNNKATNKSRYDFRNRKHNLSVR